MPATAKEAAGGLRRSLGRMIFKSSEGQSPYVYGYTMEKILFFSTGKRRRSYIVNFFRL